MKLCNYTSLATNGQKTQQFNATIFTCLTVPTSLHVLVLPSKITYQHIFYPGGAPGLWTKQAQLCASAGQTHSVLKGRGAACSIITAPSTTSAGACHWISNSTTNAFPLSPTVALDHYNSINGTENIDTTHELNPTHMAHVQNSHNSCNYPQLIQLNATCTTYAPHLSHRNFTTNTTPTEPIR